VPLGYPGDFGDREVVAVAHAAALGIAGAEDTGWISRVLRALGNDYLYLVGADVYAGCYFSIIFSSEKYRLIAPRG